MPVAFLSPTRHDKGMILTRDFYMGPPIDVARNLLGCFLCCQTDDGHIIRARIAEVELYHACERGCHAFGNKCTSRNDAMFMGGGHAYVYLCYGLHNMFNVVIGDTGMAAAVLVRAVEYDGCDGPGKLTRRLNITRDLNKWDLTQAQKLWIESATDTPKIAVGTRIGIDYAGDDAQLPWRFAIEDSCYLSRPMNKS